MLFLAFLPSKNLVRVLQMMGLSVHVHNVDIDNSVGAMGIESMEEKVAMIVITFLRVGVGDALNLRFHNWSHGIFSSRALGNQRLGLHC
jgi:hypothetical protein